MMGRHTRSTGRLGALTCDQCGAAVPTDSKFCQECGTPVTQRPTQRVRVRDEYAQRVFTFGCLVTVLAAVVVGLVIGAASRFLGVVVMLAVIIGGIIFMRILFSAGKQ